jgi:hypothetical protein
MESTVHVAEIKRFRSLASSLQAVLLVLITLYSISCGNSEEAQRKEAVQQAQFEMELQLARTDVVEKAYAEGRLGTPEKVRVEVEQYVQQAIGAGAEGDPHFLTPDGHLVPFTEQSSSQQTAFLSWITGPEVRAVVGPEMVAARDEVRRKWEQDG